ncbi:beta-agarase [Verrucomicrobia bacterium S94]|nr:beta-agarase [Verrucomicrobia bacterium S94]
MQCLYSVCIATVVAVSAIADTSGVTVTLEPQCIRNIGGVTRFCRKQFITIHESFGSIDFADEDVRYLEEYLEVEYGRDGGLIPWFATEAEADPENPDTFKETDVVDFAAELRANTSGFRLNPEDTQETVLCMHPEWMHATPTNDFRPWGPRTYQTTAEFIEKTLKAMWPDGEGMPKYLEVLNEPFIHREKNGHNIDDLSEQHNVVAEHLHKTVPGLMVGGYCAAWVDVEGGDFNHWKTHQKRFMDIAGHNMDFWSYHIYDGVNVKGTPSSRVGSNSEAVMDIIDSYSFIKFGEAKPILISEFGGIPRGNMNVVPYDSARSAHMIRSAMGQLITFMDHPDRLLKVIPYFLGKATWTYDLRGDYEPGNANPFLLWRRLADGYFVKTDLVKYYEFWKGLNGEWRRAVSSNPDIRVQLLADGDVLNVILMNIDTKEQNVKLEGLEGIVPETVVMRTLRTDGDEPVLANKFAEEVPEELTLAVGETVMLRIFMKKPVEPTEQVEESRHYATDYLKKIHAHQPVQFTFENVPTGRGTAVLRVSVGRKRDRSVLPESVEFNGHPLEIPDNWAGDQGKRGNFFGVTEFQVPMDHVKSVNEVKLVYPDDGGHAACAVLQLNRVGKLK